MVAIVTVSSLNEYIRVPDIAPPILVKCDSYLDIAGLDLLALDAYVASSSIVVS
jgi:hypothetical protein